MQTTQNNLFNNAAANAAASGGTATRAPTSATSDMFTRLLVAQIQNQDPLAPTDPSQFVNQLAQLSQTEALQSLASQGSSSAGMLQSLQVLALGAQVGSSVMVSSDHVALGAAKVSGNLALATSSGKTTLTLTGADGARHEVQLGAQAAGNVPFTLDPAKLGLPAGTYAISAQTSDGVTPGLEIGGALNSVRVAAGGAIVLNVAGVGEVGPGAVTAFNGKSGASAAN